jgi:hypothetical protein
LTPVARPGVENEKLLWELATESSLVHLINCMRVIKISLGVTER